MTHVKNFFLPEKQEHASCECNYHSEPQFDAALSIFVVTITNNFIQVQVLPVAEGHYAADCRSSEWGGGSLGLCVLLTFSLCLLLPCSRSAPFVPWT